MKKKQAISLIVLVITIIVMLILAGAIILTLNNSGIIDKASSAVNEMDKATLQEIANLGWAEAYAENALNKKLTGGALLLELEYGVKNALADNNLKPDDYGIIVTSTGVEIAKGWLQSGTTVVKGDKKLEVGDIIEYDETAGNTIENLKAVDWQILGASDNGELLILSSSNIVSAFSLGNKTTNLEDEERFKNAQKAWLTAPQQLDELCKSYGKGISATGARSIRIEDIDRITGYDKATYSKGSLQEYGSKVTFYFDETKGLTYTSTVVGEGNITGAHTDGFHYYNGKEFVRVELNNNTGMITTLYNNIYGYNVSESDLLDQSSAAYDMIFGADNKRTFFLASIGWGVGTGHVGYHINVVSSGGVPVSAIWRSFGEAYARKAGVRAVVSLDKNVNLKEKSTNTWEII